MARRWESSPSSSGSHCPRLLVARCCRRCPVKGLALIQGVRPPAIINLLKGLLRPGPILLPAPAFAASSSSGGNPNCGTSCELQLEICQTKGCGGIPPGGRWYEPYCSNCYAQCKSSGSWPTYPPCDYWNWGNPGYDPR